MAARRVHILLATQASLYLFVILQFVATGSAYDDNNRYGERQYGRDGVFVPPANAGGFRTYIYKGRSYGWEPTGFDPYNRGSNRQPGYGYDERDYMPLPGVLGRWRKDLQGKERTDSKNLDRDVAVDTFKGRVQGFKVHLYDDPTARHRPWSTVVERVTRSVNVFLGIPYALPPGKEGRFKPPRPHSGWQLLQAVDWGPACPQPMRYTGENNGIKNVDDDCLYLNVFSPNVDAGRAKLYSVMVYIHGGDFTHGASNLFPAHILAAFYDVVVVSFNYRLGALGFLSTGDENSPGNYGILDMAMALRWVHDNIKSFNGDPNSITLFGPGAGAASAGLLMVAPRTRDFVSKVIAQSGSAVSDWALVIDKYRAQNTSRVYGSMLGCPVDSSWKLVQCLVSRSFAELGNPEFQPHVGFFPWAPVLDTNFRVPPDNWYHDWHAADWHFFTEKPEEAIRQGKFRRDLMYMAGVTTQEAAYILYHNETLQRRNFEFTPEMFDQKVWELVLRYNYTLNLNGSYEAVKYMYTHWPDPSNITLVRDQYINLLSDFLYVAPFDKMAKLLIDQNVPVYLYVLNTTIEAFNYPQWRRVPHDTEHYLLSGAPFMDVEFFPPKLKFERDMWTDSDRNMSHLFMKAYSNFAKYGNPSPTQILGLHFEKATLGELRYLNINTTYNSSIKMNYRQTESAFWTNYMPKVVGRLVPTYPPDLEYWWEPKQPLQIAFWSVSALCLLLVVLSTVCCMLWRNAKRESDHYYSGDILMVRDDEPSEGIENINPASKENVYEYRDMPPRMRHTRQNESRLHDRLAQNRKFSSTPSLRSNSNVSLKDMRSEGFVSTSPNGNPKISKASSHTSLPKTKTHIIQGIPQTAV